MSSEGSITSNGSKIRQFGLYRSIDARTEEFLRLSRRRQIRQGCACAAVSTAITVTVVVVVIFVYEFSLNSEVNVETSLKNNWYSLIKDTTENKFETKYSKSDKTTLQLLPILIKALKKNVYLDKLLEEQSNNSSYPTFEEKETTEYSFEKNVFKRNWFRFPTSKLYAIAYKSTPLDKSPKNLDYFTKIRKIRDHQRVINYVDKMISEQVVTRPMLKEEITTEKTPIIKIPTDKKDFKIKQDNNIKKNDLDCKCPTTFGHILKKILSGVETLLKGNTNNKENKNECNNTEQNITRHNTNSRIDERPTTPKNINTTNHDFNYPPLIKIDSDTKTTNIRNLITKTTKRYDTFNYLKSSTSMINDHADATVATYRITKPMVVNNKYKNILNQKFNFFKNIYVSVAVKKSTATKQNKNRYHEKHFSSTVSIDRIFESKTRTPGNSDVLNEIGKLRQELINTKIIKANKPILQVKPEIISKKTVLNNVWRDLGNAIYRIMEKDNNIQIKPKPKTVRSRNMSSDKAYQNPIIDKQKPTKLKIEKIFFHLSNSTFTDNLVKKLRNNKIMENSKSLLALNKEGSNNLTKVIKTLSRKEAYSGTTETLPHKIISNLKYMDSNMTTENINTTPTTFIKTNVKLKELENLSNVTVDELLKLPNNLTKPQTLHKTDAIWEELKNENVPVWKSMIPNHRPQYLEMQKRNEWMHEQNYDFNINNYDIEL